MKNKEIDLMDVYIGEQLKEKRIALRYSLSDVGKFLGISKVTVFNYENGFTAMNISTIIKLCGLLRLDYIEVLENAKFKYLKENQRWTSLDLRNI